MFFNAQKLRLPKNVQLGLWKIAEIIGFASVVLVLTVFGFDPTELLRDEEEPKIRLQVETEDSDDAAGSAETPTSASTGVKDSHEIPPVASHPNIGSPVIVDEDERKSPPKTNNGDTLDGAIDLTSDDEDRKMPAKVTSAKKPPPNAIDLTSDDEDRKMPAKVTSAKKPPPNAIDLTSDDEEGNVPAKVTSAKKASLEEPPAAKPPHKKKAPAEKPPAAM